MHFPSASDLVNFHPHSPSALRTCERSATTGSETSLGSRSAKDTLLQTAGWLRRWAFEVWSLLLERRGEGGWQGAVDGVDVASCAGDVRRRFVEAQHLHKQDAEDAQQLFGAPSEASTAYTEAQVTEHHLLDVRRRAK